MIADFLRRTACAELHRPDVLSEYVTVDSLSLYAQFWDDPNERIAKAAEEALEQVPW